MHTTKPFGDQRATMDTLWLTEWQPCTLKISIKTLQVPSMTIGPRVLVEAYYIKRLASDSCKPAYLICSIRCIASLRVPVMQYIQCCESEGLACETRPY